MSELLEGRLFCLNCKVIDFPKGIIPEIWECPKCKKAYAVSRHQFFNPANPEWGRIREEALREL